MSEIIIGLSGPGIKLKYHQFDKKEDLTNQHSNYLKEITKSNDFKTIMDPKYFDICILQICHSKYDSIAETLKNVKNELDEFAISLDENIIVDPIEFVIHNDKIALKFDIIDFRVKCFCYNLYLKHGIQSVQYEPYFLLIIDNFDYLVSISNINRKILCPFDFYQNNNIFWTSEMQFNSFCVTNFKFIYKKYLKKKKK
jgi:hypothetical protein